MADAALQEVMRDLLTIPNFVEKLGLAVRAAIDAVLMSATTGRYNIDEVSKTEKTYVGTRVELEIISRLDVLRGTKLDMRIGQHEVDIKNTLKQNWMIPQEAFGELCLLVRSNDVAGIFSVGLLRCNLSYLGKSNNRDTKKSISADGKKAIQWIIGPNAQLPPNFLLHLSDTDRQAILTLPSGQARISELFRRCQNTRVPQYVIQTLAQPIDAQEQARDAQANLASEGIIILSGNDPARAQALGFPNLRWDEFVSTKAQ